MFAVFVTNHTGTSSFSVSNTAVEGFSGSVAPLGRRSWLPCAPEVCTWVPEHGAQASFVTRVPRAPEARVQSTQEAAAWEGRDLLEGALVSAPSSHRRLASENPFAHNVCACSA